MGCEEALSIARIAGAESFRDPRFVADKLDDLLFIIQCVKDDFCLLDFPGPMGGGVIRADSSTL